MRTTPPRGGGAPGARGVALVALILACGACARSGPREVEQRLADAAAAAAGVATPFDAVGRVRRPVLPSPHTHQVLGSNSRLTQTARGDVLDVSFVCPRALAGRAAILVVAGDGALERREVTCAADADTPTSVAGLPRGGTLPPAILGAALEPVEVPAVRVSPNARLRVALGIKPWGGALPGGTRRGARFRVVARAAQGGDAVVLDQLVERVGRPEDRSWQLVDADLEPVRRALGTELTLVFEATLGGDDEILIPMWGDPTIVPAARSETRRNVVLVSIDTLRSDRVGCYGAARPTSPALDALAAEGTRFETVMAQAPWTLPSHATMMTGLYSCAHGLGAYTTGKPFPPAVVPLAERLREIGYATAAITENGLVDAVAFRRGFGFYSQSYEGLYTVERTVQDALTWLRTEASSPFFLFVHTYQVHDYRAAPPFAGMFTPGDGGEGALASDPRIDRKQLARYDAALRYTDATLAPLLAALKEPRWRDRTLLVVTSDHGEGLGERGYFGHGRTLHEEALRVPLVWWAPGLVAAGRRLEGLVGLLDVTPTILDLLGLAVPPDLQGVSLAPQVREGEPSPLPARDLYSENSRDHYHFALRSGDTKTLYDGSNAERFDLRQDPREERPDATPGVRVDAGTLRARFEAACEGTRARLEAANPAARAQAPEPIDADQRRRLEALGYVMP